MPSIVVRTTSSAQPLNVRITPTYALATCTCMRCTQSCDEAAIHSCGACLDCCQCKLCRGCMTTFTMPGCTACGLCRSCCQCYACRQCNAPYTHQRSLCTLCGCGLNSGCGCCQHNSIASTNSITRIKCAVNLDRYRATDVYCKTNKSKRLLSAEIEVCGTRAPSTDLQKVLRGWNCSVVGDGSLPSGGFEINTHPSSGDLWLVLLSDIERGLYTSKGWVNSRAGCHIHVDAQDFGYIAMARLLRLCACIEPAMFQLVPTFRRSSQYCELWVNRYLQHIHKAEDKLAGETNDRKQIVRYRRAILDPLYGEYSREKVNGVRRSKHSSTRYRAVNVHSWFFRGTMEFRLPIGTIYANNISNWGMLLANILDVAAYRSHAEICEMTKPVEALYRTVAGLYTCGYSGFTPAFQEASMALLLNLAPSNAVRDWITSTVKYMKRFLTESSFEESF